MYPTPTEQQTCLTVLHYQAQAPTLPTHHCIHQQVSNPAYEKGKFPQRSMHRKPSDAYAPVLNHTGRLQQMVQAYPTVSTTPRPTLQKAICLQAAMTSAHAYALSFRPKMIMDPRSCAYPGGKVQCVNHLSMDWSPMDFTFINIFASPSLATKSFDEFLAQVCHQLALDGFPTLSGT